MKKFKKWLYGGLGVLFAGLVFAASNNFTDFWTINGSGSLVNTAIAWIDSTRDFSLYDGDLVFGGSGSRPTTTAGTYPGEMVPYFNAGPSSITEGQVIVALGTSTTSGHGVLTTAVSTTTVIGVAAGTTATGAVGWMRTGGWAIVTATNAVKMGDLLTSTGPAGFCAVAASPSVGTVIGKAMSTQSAGPGNVLIRIDLQ